MQVSHRTLTISGLSGNEIYCLSLAGLQPGEILVGNSVYSLGLLGSLTAGVRGLIGGEIKEYTHVISEGRRLALERLTKEIDKHHASGATGVTSELIFHGGNVEFLSIGSSVHGNVQEKFSTSEGGQDLFCQMDAHYRPIKFVFGNVAYSIGIRRGIVGSLKVLARGEVNEFSDIFNTTRHKALERISEEAKSAGANSVVGIRTSIIPFGTVGVHEMVMTGTASYNPYLAPLTANRVVTSDLTSDEMWSAAQLGLAPMELLLSTSVYSLGVISGLKSLLKSLVRGEISDLTTLIYDAREKALDSLRAQAVALDADQVIGAQTHIYQLGNGLIEFLVLGTAVKKLSTPLRPKRENLPPQAFVQDRDTFYNKAQKETSAELSNSEQVQKPTRRWMSPIR